MQTREYPDHCYQYLRLKSVVDIQPEAVYSYTMYVRSSASSVGRKATEAALAA